MLAEAKTLDVENENFRDAESAEILGTSPKKRPIRLAENPSELVSKEGFALYVGKTPAAVTSMAKAGKLPAFYMADPLNPGGHAELYINRAEWDKYARQLVEDAPEEWHDWKNRISAGKPKRARQPRSQNL